MPHKGRRRLAAIMFTDIVGYSAIMQSDETRGRMIRDRHKVVFEQCTGKYGGQIVQYYGDGTLSVFESAVSAVECAICMQKNLKTYPQVPLRIGVHLGDIHYDETEVYGHGVNVAARIEPVCNPGGVFISGKVYDEITSHPWLKAKALGVYRFKNIDQDLRLYAVTGNHVTVPNQEDIEVLSSQSQKVNISKVASHSAAVRRFVKDQNRQKQRKIIGRAIMGAVVFLALVALFTMDSFRGEIPTTEDGVSIAVLPFANMSVSQENEYFSDGMTEDILTLISKIEGLRVTSRTSVMHYKNSSKKVPDIARELGVNHILEGSVRRDGDRVRINAQLIDARDDSHVWAHTYDEEITNIFDVQSQVASDIALQLNKTLSINGVREVEGKKQVNVTAYDLYLKGREAYRRYDQEGMKESVQLYREALLIEPDYAYAYSGLGDAYAQLAFMAGRDEHYLDTSVLMSARAVKLDPDLSEGYKALGLAFHYQGKYDEAIVQYEKALELDPYNDMAANNLGMIQKERGKWGEAARWAQRTLDINRSVPSSAANMADLYISVGDYDKAEVVVEESISANPEDVKLRILKAKVDLQEGDLASASANAEQVIESLPHEPVGYDLMGNVYLYEGDWDNAYAHFNKAEEQCNSSTDKVIYQTMSNFSWNKAHNVSAEDQSWEEMEAQLSKLEEENPHFRMYTARVRAGIEASRGNVDLALAELDTAFSYNWIDYATLTAHPIYQELKEEPEFRQVIKEMQMRSDSLKLVVKEATRRDGT